MDVDPAPGEPDLAPVADGGSDLAMSPTRRRRNRRRQGRPVQLMDDDATAPTTRPGPRPDAADDPGAAADQDLEVEVLGADAPEDEEAAAPQLPPLLLRDGLPPLTDSPAALAETLDALRAGDGPLAIDTERASGYRYGQRAYLIQIRRNGAGTHLVDPSVLPGVPGLAEVLTGPEWILHAATQDLPCLAELDLHPQALFDTELAGRLLGMPRVGLAPMVAELLGRSLAKGHGGADWSRRPLPDDWLEYAALDVEVLLELRDELAGRLRDAGKLEWALEEFEAIRTAPPAEARTDPWRRTAGIHQVRNRRGLAIVQQLWTARDDIARQVDMAPGRLLPDASIVAAARALPADVGALRAMRTFQGRGAARYHREWGRALQAAWAIPDGDLPKSSVRTDGPPPARVWSQRDPAAAARLDRARTALARRAAELELPVENLVAPDLVRRLVWDPESSIGNDVSASAIATFLRRRGARAWQVEQVADLLETAISHPA